MKDTTYKKKLIEVALPLEIINEASGKEKSIRKGHPSTLHLWWARRTIAAGKAIIFSSIVDDPSNYLPQKEAIKERKKLFKIIEELVKWKNGSAKDVQKKAYNYILESTKNNPPAVLDPFSGGGTIPLSAQMLGLEGYGLDVNPVATLISKSLIEIPPKFVGVHPINPSYKRRLSDRANGLQGLAEDINYYGALLQESVKAKLNLLYPNTKDGKIVSAYLWCRTVKCPNPACNTQVPLVKSYYLLKKNNQTVTLIPEVIDKLVHFKISNKDTKQDGNITNTGAVCPCCNAAIPFKFIREEGKLGKLSNQLIALMAEDKKDKYRSADEEQIRAIQKVKAEEKIQTEIPDKALGFRVQLYGIKKHSDLFTDRQYLVLDTFANELQIIKKKILHDVENSSTLPTDEKRLCVGGKGKVAYVDAIITYLALGISKSTNSWSTLCSWNANVGSSRNTFARQTLSMTWDYIEVNPFSNSGGNFLDSVELIADAVLTSGSTVKGEVKNMDSSANLDYENLNPIISTDPPYYDNIGYADLSDYFYVWLRKMLSNTWPELFSTMLTPKSQELIATPFRFDGDMDKAEQFFREGMEKVLKLIEKKQNKDFPITIYYAFKQSESETSEENNILHSSTGWETMLDAILKSKLSIVGTWPIRTERSARPRGIGSNALASSIVIVCRPRSDTAPISTRREFVNSLKKELPSALKNLQEAGIAPVDMAQSAIGPGMAVFSRYSKVLEADGTPMTVRTALQIINQELDTYFSEQEADMDKETRFCISWYEQFGWNEGPFGDANTLATAKGTAVNALESAEVVYAKAGKVRLLKRKELDENWDPTTDKKLTVWECVQHIIKALDEKGETGAAEIIRKIGGLADPVKELAYRLYSLCERKGWTEDGLSYNSIISSWQSINDKAQFAEQVSEETKKKIKEKSQKTLNDI